MTISVLSFYDGFQCLFKSSKSCFKNHIVFMTEFKLLLSGVLLGIGGSLDLYNTFKINTV